MATQPSWNLIIHDQARDELHSIPDETASNLKDTLHTAKNREQPSDVSNIKLLRDANQIFRVREGKYRALCDLHPPHLRVLLIDHRETCYDQLDKAKERQADS